MSDQPPRTALEIAMERLREKDARDGVERRLPTPEQKAAIAELRSVYEAKLAQEDVMYQQAALEAPDPQVLTAVQDEHRRTRERLNAERDAKIERIRNGDNPV
jgi:hypothetical protein